MNVKRSIAPHVALGLHPVEKLLDRRVLGRLASGYKMSVNWRIVAGPRSHRIRKTASSDSVMSCAGRPIILLVPLVVLSELSVVLSEFRLEPRDLVVKRGSLCE